MKTFKDIYKFPLRNNELCGWVYDSADNFVFQFEPRFNNKGDFQDGWQDFETQVLDALNGKQPMKGGQPYHFKEGEIFRANDNKAVITIRGWGNLTGIGAHNLPAEDAANIQDTFGNFIVETLNK